MKSKLVLIVLFVCSIIITKFSSAQNEIEKYKQPDLIEGSNLYFTFHPGYSSHINYDTIKSKSLDISSKLDFYKWRFTRKLDYSFHINEQEYFDWSSSKNPPIIDTTYTRSIGGAYAEGGVSYYFLKDLFYSGIYLNSNINLESGQKPSYFNNIFPFIGFGKLVNAGQVIYTKNFEQVLRNEGIIMNKLPLSVSRKLTVLLDKKSKSEFKSKYKDDEDIEFFSQIEKLLLDEKIIDNPFDSRTTLKLYQALKNNTFIYYPRYKGFSAQAELSYNNINQLERDVNENFLLMLLSGVYALPLGYTTDLVFTGYAGIPLNQKQAHYYDYSFYHSPQIIREPYLGYRPWIGYFSYIRKYNYVAGLKMLSYYSFSYTSGISAYLQYQNGYVNNEKTDYNISADIEFSYNILSHLILNSHIYFYNDQSLTTQFSSGVNINYIVF